MESSLLMQSHTILLDFDGTVSEPDNLLRQYVEALTLQFKQQHGGDIEEWRTITQEMLKRLTEEFQDRFVNHPNSPYNSFMEEKIGRAHV